MFSLSPSSAAATDTATATRTPLSFRIPWLCHSQRGDRRRCIPPPPRPTPPPPPEHRSRFVFLGSAIRKEETAADAAGEVSVDPDMDAVQRRLMFEGEIVHYYGGIVCSRFSQWLCSNLALDLIVLLVSHAFHSHTALCKYNFYGRNVARIFSLLFLSLVFYASLISIVFFYEEY
ncbi:uncharacterized protein LOC109835435 [Asparagus officinalis]|uniref:uncharacterized protein LOC109835435 n=1 Tax=Asparagus officinalis TaxID=4686 RepID=UPI00098E6634|nr:uncharacterized protein LOC109835435 [Asparagus officinalis]